MGNAFSRGALFLVSHMGESNAPAPKMQYKARSRVGGEWRELGGSEEDHRKKKRRKRGQEGTCQCQTNITSHHRFPPPKKGEGKLIKPFFRRPFFSRKWWGGLKGQLDKLPLC